MHHLPLWSAVSIVLLLTACMPSKEADIVGAAVIAELAQTQNARPSDIVVDKVSFQNERRASIEASYRLPNERLPHSVTFACDASKTEDRWSVKCTARQTQ